MAPRAFPLARRFGRAPPYLSASWTSHDVPGSPSAWPGTRRVARHAWLSIMVDVLREDLLPTTANIKLPKSQPKYIRG